MFIAEGINYEFPNLFSLNWIGLEIDKYTVITHELSHQWFGNTITMPWWSQFYLNEGFARYWQYVAATALFPEMVTTSSNETRCCLTLMIECLVEWVLFFLPW